MLNSPGEHVAPASPETDQTEEQSEFSAMRQLAVIAVVAIYLFAIVWVYAKLPLLAAAGTLIALGYIAGGIIRDAMRKG